MRDTEVEAMSMCTIVCVARIFKGLKRCYERRLGSQTFLSRMLELVL